MRSIKKGIYSLSLVAIKANSTLWVEFSEGPHCWPKVIHGMSWRLAKKKFLRGII